MNYYVPLLMAGLAAVWLISLIPRVTSTRGKSTGIFPYKTDRENPHVMVFQISEDAVGPALRSMDRRLEDMERSLFKVAEQVRSKLENTVVHPPATPWPAVFSMGANAAGEVVSTMVLKKQIDKHHADTSERVERIHDGLTRILDVLVKKPSRRRDARASGAAGEEG